MFMYISIWICMVIKDVIVALGLWSRSQFIYRGTQHSRHSLGCMHEPFAEAEVGIILFKSLILAAHVAWLFMKWIPILILTTFMNTKWGFILCDVGRSVSQSRRSFMPAYLNTMLWKIYEAGCKAPCIFDVRVTVHRRYYVKWRPTRWDKKMLVYWLNMFRALVCQSSGVQ
jgi:hypothetical protein